MPVAYSYIRFSTPDQIKGDSLRRQLEASSKYAAEHNLILDDTLNVHDLGVSAFKGTNFESGALGQFIISIDEGRIARDSYLLVESLDRLSRLPVTDALAIFQSIISRGITIVTLTDSTVYSKERLQDNWTPLLIALVSMSRAHEESALKSRRVKAAWDAKKVRVKENKEVMSGRCPWWLKPSADNKIYEINEINAEVVRLMFQLAKDGLGNMLIAKYLNSRDIATPQHSLRWQNSTVGFNLRNIAAIGVLQLDQDNNGRTTTNTFVEDYYPPVVDKTLFYEVQAIRNSRNRNKNTMSAGRKGLCYNIFQGTAKCGYCGGSVHIRRKPGINSAFLYCAKSLQGGGCIGVSYNVRQLETEFLTFTKELNLASVLGDTSATDNLAAKESDLAACIGKLEEFESKMNNLLTAVESGSDVTFLVQRLRDVEAELNNLKKRRLALQTEVDSLRNSSPNDQESVENLSALLEQLENKSTDLDDKYRLRFRLLTEVQKLVRRIDLYPGGIINTEEQINKLALELENDGFDRERIAAYLSQERTKPDRKAKFFVAHFHNGVKRSVVNGILLESIPKKPLIEKLNQIRQKGLAARNNKQ